MNEENVSLGSGPLKGLPASRLPRPSKTTGQCLSHSLPSSSLSEKRFSNRRALPSGLTQTVWGLRKPPIHWRRPPSPELKAACGAEPTALPKATSLPAAPACGDRQSLASRQLELEGLHQAHTTQNGNFLFVLTSYQLDGDMRQNPDIMGLQKRLLPTICTSSSNSSEIMNI